MIPVEVLDSAERLGDALASAILDNAQRARMAGRRYVLGCPAGRSLRPTYRALGQIAATSSANLAHFHVVMMDEFVEPVGEGWRCVSPDAHFSCAGFAVREIVESINSGLPQEKRLPAAHLHLPDPSDPADYERLIAELGGIDLFLLASGASDGHVAFNPPGTPIDSRTRIVDLAETTRRDGLGSFPGFADIRDVPTQGVSIGLGTIVRWSREVVLVMTGEEKARSMEAIASSRGFDPAWPATVVHRCPGAGVMVDRALADAASVTPAKQQAAG